MTTTPAIEIDPELRNWLDEPEPARQQVLVRFRAPVAPADVAGWEALGVHPAPGAPVAPGDLDRPGLRALLDDPRVEAISAPPRMYPRVR